MMSDTMDFFGLFMIGGRSMVCDMAEGGRREAKTRFLVVEDRFEDLEMMLFGWVCSEDGYDRGTLSVTVEPAPLFAAWFSVT